MLKCAQAAKRETARKRSNEMNCWEYNKCGREMGGARSLSLGVCAAWPDNGQNCAFVVGTLSENRDPGRSCVLKDCWECAFYRESHHFKPSRVAAGAI